MTKLFLPAATLVTRQAPEAVYPYAANRKTSLEERPLLVRLHHFVCLSSYAANRGDMRINHHWNSVCDKINDGAKIEIVGGIDSFCDNSRTNYICPSLARGTCHQKTMNARDLLAQEDLQNYVRVRETDFEIGEHFIPTPNLLSELRTAFKAYTIRSCCTECSNSKLCTAVAEADFKNVRAFPYARAKKGIHPLFN